MCVREKETGRGPVNITQGRVQEARMTRGPLASVWTIEEMMHKSELTMHGANDRVGGTRAPLPVVYTSFVTDFYLSVGEALPLS